MTRSTLDRPRIEYPETGIEYPESDGGKPVESDAHRAVMLGLIDLVDRRYVEDPDVYVSGNLFIYYVEGNPRKSIGPDFFMARGVRKGWRRTFRLWEEPAGPQVVIEVTSPKTWKADLGKKKAIYEKLGVLEYFVFDPLQEYLEPPLEGFRLEAGRFRPMEAAWREKDALVLFSEVMGLELHGRFESMRLRDRATGEFLLDSKELEKAMRSSKERATRAEQRSRAARRRAQAEKKRAEEERRRAEEERERADSIEAELARAREELRRLRGER